jgi:hypothetical protein
MGIATKGSFRFACYAILLGSFSLICGVSTGQAATREEPPSATTQNENFVVSAPDLATAQAVLAKAEGLRRSLAIQWLGEALPDGIAPTVIRVVLSDDEDKGLTWVADRADRLSHMMWLTTSRERATGSTLAHEMTHVVLSTRYPGELPAWLDEGIASRQDDSRRVAARREILVWYARTGNWPSLVEVLSAQKIAGSDRARYALSASVTDYLLSQSDVATLFEFAQAGRTGGWDAALRTHYGIAHTRALETRWRDWASRR